MKLIKLTKGLFTKVDDELFEELNKHKWHALGERGKEYAARRKKMDEPNPQSYIYMHQQIIPDAYEIDHRDRDRLNNQKYNLRKSTRAENAQNTELAQNQRGIGRDWTHNTWKAYINIPGKYGTKRINVGTFQTFDAAKSARDKYIERNFPSST